MMNENFHRLSTAFFVILTTFGITIKAQDEADNYCYALDANPYWSFGSITPYEFVRSRKMEIPDYTVCKPIYIWGLVRPGIRNSPVYDAKITQLLGSRISIINDHEKKNRGKLHPKDVENLKKWTIYDQKERSPLMSRGREESYNLGKRLAEKFKDLIANPSENFLVYRMGDSRLVRDSAESFFKGMFGDSAKVDTLQVDDEIFQGKKEFSDMFEDTNLNAKKKEYQCYTSESMKNLQKEVTLRLGYKNNDSSLSNDTIIFLYEACALEFAWTTKSKPAFCAAFTKSQLELVEYCHQEIMGYYRMGYGSKFAVELSRRMFNDIVLKFEAASKSENPQFNGEITFARNPALVILILKLGLYNDEEPLPVDNPITNKQRQWSMTKIAPFNGNVLIVLQKCKDGELKVSTYHNEELIQMPGCSSMLCPWSDFKKVLKMKSVP